MCPGHIPSCVCCVCTGQQSWLVSSAALGGWGSGCCACGAAGGTEPCTPTKLPLICGGPAPCAKPTRSERCPCPLQPVGPGLATKTPIPQCPHPENGPNPSSSSLRGQCVQRPSVNRQAPWAGDTPTHQLRSCRCGGEGGLPSSSQPQWAELCSRTRGLVGLQPCPTLRPPRSWTHTAVAAPPWEKPGPRGGQL